MYQIKCNSIIEYKLNFDDEYSDLNIAQKKRKIVKINSINYKQLHESPLSSQIQMARSTTI